MMINGILLCYLLLLLTTVIGWFNRRLGVFLFCLFLIYLLFLLWHHATSHLNIYL